MMNTNTIRVLLSPGESLHAATTAFRQFGDVSSLELLPGDVLMASVVFFDVRAAAQALQTMGFDVAEPAPQTGNRIAVLKGDRHLKADHLGSVSNVFLDSTCQEGTYAVEFYDIRDASRAQELEDSDSDWEEDSERALKASGAPPGLDSQAAPQQPVPVYVIPSAAALPASTAAAVTRAAAAERAAMLPGAQPVACTGQPAAPSPQELQPAHFTVRITGIPNALLPSPCMEAVLQQAGLLDATIHFKTEPGKGGQQSGDVLVTFLTYPVAQQCISHFLGRQWNTTGGEVSAWLEPAASAAPGEWGSQPAVAEEEELEEEARKRCDSSNTEASTATGPASDAEEDRDGDVPSRL